MQGEFGKVDLPNVPEKIPVDTRPELEADQNKAKMLA